MNQGKRRPPIAGNISPKYTSKNFIVKYLMNRFFRDLDRLLCSIRVRKVLDVGCGEGYVSQHIAKLLKNVYIEGCDLQRDIITLASQINPGIKFSVQSCYKLSYEDNEFDLVIACELLEHLEDVLRAIEEIKRVSSKLCLFSVPQEPLWRILNLLRGKYIRELGNTPGHLQHWKAEETVEMLKKHFIIKKVLKPLPWTMVLCEVKSSDA